jgi:hypothetical protein
MAPRSKGLAALGSSPHREPPPMIRNGGGLEDLGYSDFSEAMSMENRYFTSDLVIRS